MTRVYFRKWSRSGDIIAVFPDQRGSKVQYGGTHDTVGSYEHIGQHGAADYYLVMQYTRPAKPNEYADLQKELESAPYHYHLKVYQRASYAMHKQRRTVIHRLQNPT